MTVIYSFIDSRGINHDIRQRDIEEAYRTLLFAGFDMRDAHEKSLDYVLAKLQLASVSDEDLLYANHEFHSECAFTSLVAHRLMTKETQRK